MWQTVHNKLQLTLANKVSENGNGLDASIMDYLKHKFSCIKLIPVRENAEGFYKHLRFKNAGFGMIWKKYHKNKTIKRVFRHGIAENR